MMNETDTGKNISPLRDFFLLPIRTNKGTKDLGRTGHMAQNHPQDDYHLIKQLLDLEKNIQKNKQIC